MRFASTTMTLLGLVSLGHCADKELDFDAIEKNLKVDYGKEISFSENCRSLLQDCTNGILWPHAPWCRSEIPNFPFITYRRQHNRWRTSYEKVFGSQSKDVYQQQSNSVGQELIISIVGNMEKP